MSHGSFEVPAVRHARRSGFCSLPLTASLRCRYCCCRLLVGPWRCTGRTADYCCSCYGWPVCFSACCFSAASIPQGTASIGYQRSALWRRRSTSVWRRPLLSVPILVAAVLALSVQASASVGANVARAEGYEEAAQFVLQTNPGPTVLFSGDVDTGFFTFFVRKHDSARRVVVLRSDKILTTSLLARTSVEDRITQPEEIYGVLNTFGIKFIVIEDRPSGSRVLEWLRHELRSPRFVERRRIPFRTSDRRLRGTSLVIYEYTNTSPPADDAVLSMSLPVVRSSVTVKLSDLIDRKYLR